MFKLNVKALSYNRYYRILKGRYIISKVGREYRETIQEQMKNIGPGNGFFEYPTKGPLSLGFVFNFKDRKKRDLDNLLKGIIDTLKGILYVDDSQIEELRATKHVTNEESIEITMIPIPVMLSVKMN